MKGNATDLPPARFRLLLLVWHVALPGLLAGMIGVAAGVLSGDFEPVYAFAGAAAAGFAVYVLQIPNMAVLFGSSLYRARFEALMRLPAQEQPRDDSESE